MDATQLSQDLPESATWLNAPPATLMHFQGRPLVVAFVNVIMTVTVGAVWFGVKVVGSIQACRRNFGW